MCVVALIPRLASPLTIDCTVVLLPMALERLAETELKVPAALVSLKIESRAIYPQRLNGWLG